MGFETLKNIIEENKIQIELDNQEAVNPIMCPEDWRELDVNSKGGRSCPICGRIWRI